MNQQLILTILIAFFGGTGGIAALLSFLKIKPERAQLFLQSAKTAVDAQDTVIENMSKEIARLVDIVARNEKHIVELQKENKILRDLIEELHT